MVKDARAQNYLIVLWKESGEGVDAIEDRPLTESLPHPSGLQRTDDTINTLAVPTWE